LGIWGGRKGRGGKVVKCGMVRGREGKGRDCREEGGMARLGYLSRVP